jgi:nitrogen-specific signal transduction histidine kinase
VSKRRWLEEELRQSQKMDAVGRLAGGIAHDFNNLLTAINGYAEVGLNLLEGGERPVQELTEIRKAGERAAELTRQLLAFSRRQVLRPSVVDLNEVVADMERLLARVIGENVLLRVSLASELPRVEADRTQLEQVLMNLAVNARDAMAVGGAMAIETSEVNVGAADQGLHPGVLEGHYVVLLVGDTGIGMDPPTVARAFEPFFTTKELGKGTGLGLATVHGIVQQSGGQIRVDSESGGGTRFYVYLPAVGGATPHVGSPHGDSPVSSARATILLAEDEPAVRGLLVKVLEGNGYQVLAAENGAMAVEIGRGLEGGIDLLVTDIVMPILGGHETAAQLRELQPGLRVLFLSGYTANPPTEDPQAGSDFLLKPFQPAELASRVRALLDVEPVRPDGH